MFADDTNLFFTHENIRYLLKKKKKKIQTVNKKLETINQWFISKKLSLNIKKNKKLIFP